MELTNAMPTEIPAFNLKKSQTSTYAEMTQWVLPTHTNALGSVFGGVLVSWIDVVGVAAAQRYARAPVVTLSMDQIEFLRPIKVGFMAVIKAALTFTGRTSLEIEATVEAEDTITGKSHPAVRAYLTYVALDEAGRPTEIPPLELRTEEDRSRFDAALLRRERRKLLR